MTAGADDPTGGARPWWPDRLEAGGERIAPLLEPFWTDRRIGFAAAVAIVAPWGAASGWWMPRGPLTTAQALSSMLLSLLVGLGAGLVMRSRWAMLAAPVAFTAVFELVRLGTDGPTVDGIHLSTYGLIALTVGRGFHGLLSIFPMVVGATFGAGCARWLATLATSMPDLEGRPRLRTVRRVVATLAALALVLLAVGIARPARTAAIVDADGEEIPGSIAALTRVEIGGHDLALMIRGHDVENPVLLFLAGGPGGSEMGSMRRHLAGLEEHFTVVTWDQRGAGKSYVELDPTDTLTLDSMVADTVELSEHLRRRFDTERIYLLGQSWGTTLGVLAARERPDLYEAFVGTGQMVSQRETDRLIYADTLEWATASGRDGLAGTLRSLGPPPYDDVLDYEPVLSHEQEVYPYDHSGNSEGEGQMSENLFVAEYTLVEQVHVVGAFLDTFATLYPQLQDIDFRATATDFDIPMFFAQGAHEARGRAALFDEWYPMVDAPIKDLAVLDTSGHRPLFEQPDEFVAFMADVVLARTRPG